MTQLAARNDSWNRALAASPGALDVHVAADQVEGAVPDALFGGRLLCNGPGWNVIGDVTVHPFDGHGYVRAFSFAEDGSVRLRARFVETPTYVAEREAGRLVHRGFATNLDGSFLRNLPGGPPRNVANTTIQRWNGRLLAGWEAGAPYALDPASLETLGEESLGGAISGQATLAHMKREARTGRLIVCSVAAGLSSTFTFRELDGDDQVVSTVSAELPGPLFTHDFALAGQHYVLGGNPLRVDMLGFAKARLGFGTVLPTLSPDTAKAPVLHLVSRVDGTLRTVSLAEPGWIVHFGAAFEEDDGTVVVDAAVMPPFSFGEEFGYSGPHAPFDIARPEARGPQQLLRYRIAPGATAATAERLCAYGVDFPRFHPEHEGLPTPVLFGATRADTRFSDPFDSLIRVDLQDPSQSPQLWTVPENSFVGEPVFVPDPCRPDGGHVLALVSQGLQDRTLLVVLDASDLAAGPVASVPLPLLPVAFHGDWDAQALRA